MTDGVFHYMFESQDKDSHKWGDQHRSERDRPTNLHDRRLIENPNRKELKDQA